MKKSIAIIGEGETEWFYFESLRIARRYPFKLSPGFPQHADIEHILKLAKASPFTFRPMSREQRCRSTCFSKAVRRTATSYSLKPVHAQSSGSCCIFCLITQSVDSQTMIS